MKDGGVEHSQFPHVLTELEKPGTWAKHEYKKRGSENDLEKKNAPEWKVRNEEEFKLFSK